VEQERRKQDGKFFSLGFPKVVRDAEFTWILPSLTPPALTLPFIPTHHSSAAAIPLPAPAPRIISALVSLLPPLTSPPCSHHKLGKHRRRLRSFFTATSTLITPLFWHSPTYKSTSFNNVQYILISSAFAFEFYKQSPVFLLLHTSLKPHLQPDSRLLPPFSPRGPPTLIAIYRTAALFG